MNLLTHMRSHSFKNKSYSQKKLARENMYNFFYYGNIMQLNQWLLLSKSDSDTLCFHVIQGENWSIKWWPSKLMHLRKEKCFCRRTVKVQKNITNLAGNREWFAICDWALTALLEKNWSCWMGMARILDFISSSLVDLLPRMPGWVFINLSGPISSIWQLLHQWSL